MLVGGNDDGEDGLRILVDVLRTTCPHLKLKDCPYLFPIEESPVQDLLKHMSEVCHDNNYLRCPTYIELNNIREKK